MTKQPLENLHAAGQCSPPSRLRPLAVALLGDPATVDLDHRIMRGVMFLTAATGLLSTLHNLAIGAAWVLSASTGVCAIGGMAGYLAARRPRGPRELRAAVLLFFLSLAAVCWIAQAGSEGSVGYYVVLVAVYAASVFRGRARPAALGLVAATLAGLLVLERLAPGRIRPYDNPAQRFADAAFAIPFCAFMAATVLRLVFREYRRERAAKDNVLALVTAEKERVERGMREKQRLLTVVSHDIANALTVLQGEISLARFAARSDATPHPFDLDRMVYACANIEEIISSVRMMEAMEQGRIAFRAKPVDLAAVFEYAEVIFGQRLARRRMRVVFPELTAATRLVMAEPRILANQVFGNVLSNAIKFSYPDTVITVSVERTGGETTVAVADRGIGIPATLLPRLFDLEAQTTRPGTDGEPGTGFGLRTVKHFVELFGGRLDITSRAEAEHPDAHGTTVAIHLRSEEASSERPQ